MPYVPAGIHTSRALVIGGDFDTVDDFLRRHDLIGPHDQQQVFARQHTVLHQNIENGMLGEEGLGEVHKVGNHLVIAVSPEGCKLKGIAGLLNLPLTVFLLSHRTDAGGIGIIFRMSTVADNENLHILVEPAPSPEAVPLVAVNLMKSLFQCYPAAL